MMSRVVSARTAREGLAYITRTLPAGPPPPTAAASATTTTTTTTTVLFAHANGFCKECFLPLWDELAALAPFLETPVRLVAFDFSGHGDSEPVAGPDCDWRRVAAGDVKAMLEEVGGQGQGQGQDGRQGCCIGVGHSLGAAAMVMAELQQPPDAAQPLFDGGLVLIEPILLYTDGDRSMIHPLADRALKRRTSWPSRAAARVYLQSRGVFSTWDRRALDCYVEHALGAAAARTPGGGGGGAEAVTLKCRPETEAGFYRGAGSSVWPDLHRLGHRAHPPVLFVAGSASDHMRVILRAKGSATAVAEELVGLMGPETRLHVEKGASHFVPMERPQAVASLVAAQLLRALTPSPPSRSQL